MTNHPGADVVLEANRALRLWAAGLRSWSSAARAASSAERHRAEHLKAHLSDRRTSAPELLRSALERQQPAEGPVLPSFGDVHVEELLGVLVRRHGFGSMGAVHALQVAMLMAGYPSDTEEVLAADTWEILDLALRYPR